MQGRGRYRAGTVGGPPFQKGSLLVEDSPEAAEGVEQLAGPFASDAGRELALFPLEQSLSYVGIAYQAFGAPEGTLPRWPFTRYKSGRSKMTAMMFQSFPPNQAMWLPLVNA